MRSRRLTAIGISEFLNYFGKWVRSALVKPSASYGRLRKGFLIARPSLFTFLVLLAVSTAQGQIPVPAGTLSQYVLNGDGTYSYGVDTAEIQDGEFIGLRDAGGNLNGYGGGVLDFANPAGGSFGGENWGGTAFLLGYVDSDSNDLIATNFSGYLFQPAPISDDVAIIAPLGTDATDDGSLQADDGLAGASAQDAGSANGIYVYQGIYSQATSYTVDMGGNTVADLIVDAGLPPADAGAIEATPNLDLSGAFTSTYQALIAGNDDQAVTISGSKGGSFSTAFLDLYGQVNVTGGELSGDFMLIDSQIDPNIRAAGGELPSSFTAVDVSGADASIVSSESLLIGRSDDLPAELTIENDATGTFDNVYVGCGDADSLGSLKIDNAQVQITGFLEVGSGGAGTLTVQDGATLMTGTGQSDTDTGAYIQGADEDDESTTTVDGDGSTWTNKGNLSIGYYADAPSSLTVSNGGDVSTSGELIVGSGMGGMADVQINSGGTLESGTGQAAGDLGGSVGDTDGSTGTVEIMGSGSKWTVSSSLSIGGGSNGTVTVEQGGALEVDGNLTIGSDGGTGSLIVEGGGSGPSGDVAAIVHPDSGELTTYALLTGAGSGAVSNLMFGDGGTGTVTITGGASANLTASSIILGSHDGYGCLMIYGTGTGSDSDDLVGGIHPDSAELTTTVLLTAAGSQTVSNAFLTLGDSGTGCLQADGSSQVTVDGTVMLGNEVGSDGMITLSDPDTSLTIDEDPIIGMNGTGTVTIQGGAGLTVMNGDLILGQGTTGLGSLQVTGTGTTLLEEGDLIVGGASTLANTMNVSAGGLAQIEGNGIVGRDAGSNGTITIDGSGSTLQIEDLTIGQDGTGAVTVQNSGTLTETGDLILGQNANSNGSLTVDGPSTTFSYTGGDVAVGSSGTGTMTVQNGALVDLTGTAVTLGDENTGNGTLVVTDVGSQLNTGDLTIGGSGMGALTVKDGATLNSDSSTIGDEKGSSGTSTVTGDSSTWTASDLTVGGGGTGELDIEDGGTVSASGDKLTLGDESTGSGTITISDAGSALKFTGEIDDGENGMGVVAVQGGASFTAFSLNIGDKGTGNGTLNVTGAGTTMEVQQDFNVGEQGTGALNVTNGAHLLNDADATLADLGGSGTAVIDSNSVWTIGGDLSVGHQGIGGLQVTAESFVSASNITLGEIAGGGAGTAIISGSDSSASSTLQYDNLLKVGDGGSGELDVQAGATVKDSGKGNEADAGSLDIAAQTGSTGKVKVDGAGSSLSATNINVGGTATTAGGTGFLSATNGGSIDAPGKVIIQAKGTVAIEANSSLTANGGVMVNAGGLLGGGGTIHGNVTNAGTVAPGDPQTTTIDGNYTQVAGGFLMLSLAGNAPGDYDQFNVTGELSVESGSALQLNFIDGFAPTLGETFDLVNYGTLDPLNVSFSTVDVTGLASGFEYALTPVGTGETDFQLTALNNAVSTTPEPSTWALVLASISLIAFKARRMRQTT
jgi:T5SS/PEP-CTERM-associated repeat protein